MKEYLTEKNRARKRYLFKKLVLERDNHICQKCGSKELIEAHHIIPISQKGTWELDNGITLCEICHLKAHNKRKTGKKPKHISYYRKFYYSSQIRQPYLEYIKDEAKNCCGEWRRHITCMIRRLIILEGNKQKLDEYFDKYDLK